LLLFGVEYCFLVDRLQVQEARYVCERTEHVNYAPNVKLQLDGGKSIEDLFGDDVPNHRNGHSDAHEVPEHVV
jgi:hypothetical protein